MREISRLCRRGQLCRHLVNGLLELGVDLVSDTGGAEEVAVEDSANVAVGFEDGADRTAAFELPVCAASPSDDKVDKDDVSDPALCSRLVGGLRGTAVSLFFKEL